MRGSELWLLDQPAIVLVNEPQAALEILMHLERACGLLPRFMAEPIIKAGRLRALASDWAGRDVRIYFATPPGRGQVPAVQALADELHIVMRSDPNWAI